MKRVQQIGVSGWLSAQVEKWRFRAAKKDKSRIGLSALEENRPFSFIIRMLSDDKKKALLVLQHALECLETLLSMVGPDFLLSWVRERQSRLASGEMINFHEMGLPSKIRDEVILSARSGYKLTELQQVWVDACFERADSVAGGAAWFLSICDRLIVKEPFAIGGEREHEIRTISCPRCRATWVGRKDVLAAAAAIWAHLRVRPPIEAGQGKEAVEEALACSFCSPFILVVEDILRQKDIKRVENSGEGCPSCGWRDVRYSQFTISWDSVQRALQTRVV